MMKLATIIFMVFILVTGSAVMARSSSEGPTVIIVGSEREKEKADQHHGHENNDQYPIEENDRQKKSYEPPADEVENPEGRNMDNFEQDIDQPE